jgi:hypothetical protein
MFGTRHFAPFTLEIGRQTIAEIPADGVTPRGNGAFHSRSYGEHITRRLSGNHPAIGTSASRDSR